MWDKKWSIFNTLQLSFQNFFRILISVDFFTWLLQNKIIGGVKKIHDTKKSLK